MKPNVFIFTIDALRFDAYRDYIREGLVSVDGVEFTQAISTANATAHSIPSLAVGVYADSVGYGLDLDDRFTTLAEQLDNTGYQCSLWSDNYLFGAEYNYDRGFSNKDIGKPTWKKQIQTIINKFQIDQMERSAKWAYFNLYKRLAGEFFYETYYNCAEDMNENAKSWLSNKHNRDIMCWIHYMDTHHPFEPPDEYLAEFEFYNKPTREYLSELSTEAIVNNGYTVTKEDIDDIKNAYLASCKYVRDQLSSILEHLLDNGYFDPNRDILIITSDHGEGFNIDLHNSLGHTPTPSFWEEVVRVPLFISRPDWEPREYNGQVSLIDLMPTILEAADLPIPTTVEGTPARTPKEMERSFAYFTANGGDYSYHGVRSEEGWKLMSDRITSGSNDEEKDIQRVVLTHFEDYNEDIMYEVSFDDIHPPNDEKKRKKWDLLFDQLVNHRDYFYTERGAASELSEETMEHLEKLGYIDDIR